MAEHEMHWRLVIKYIGINLAALSFAAAALLLEGPLTAIATFLTTATLLLTLFYYKKTR